jgi:hypothetical protein
MHKRAEKATAYAEWGSLDVNTTKSCATAILHKHSPQDPACARMVQGQIDKLMIQEVQVEVQPPKGPRCLPSGDAHDGVVMETPQKGSSEEGTGQSKAPDQELHHTEATVLLSCHAVAELRVFLYLPAVLRFHGLLSTSCRMFF